MYKSYIISNRNCFEIQLHCWWNQADLQLLLPVQFVVRPRYPRVTALPCKRVSNSNFPHKFVGVVFSSRIQWLTVPRSLRQEKPSVTGPFRVKKLPAFLLTFTVRFILSIFSVLSTAVFSLFHALVTVLKKNSPRYSVKFALRLIGMFCFYVDSVVRQCGLSHISSHREDDLKTGRSLKPSGSLDVYTIIPLIVAKMIFPKSITELRLQRSSYALGRESMLSAKMLVLVLVMFEKSFIRYST